MTISLKHYQILNTSRMKITCTIPHTQNSIISSSFQSSFGHSRCFYNTRSLSLNKKSPILNVLLLKKFHIVPPLSSLQSMNISTITCPLNQNVNTSINDETDTVMSRRSEFKSIPIQQSILSYIKSIGVGIRSKKRRKKRISATGDKSKDLLSTQDEKDFLLKKNNQIRRGITRNSNPIKITQNGLKTKITTTTNPDSNHNDSHNHNSKFLLPPPPFSSSHTINQTINKIKRLPIKVLGSIGSIDEIMPRSSKGLPEVAIIGRSNVGKSTLLNALLYGNQELLENKTFVRGKTPNGAKMGKGIKAVVSDKPGETKKITFYQLTAQIDDDNEGSKSDDSTTDDNSRKSSKMSLVLIDLPGYGFAYTSEEKAENWLNLMNYFLINREKSLKRILLLIDARHGFKKADFDFLSNLQKLGGSSNNLKNNESSIFKAQKMTKKFTLPPIQVVLTKCDLVSQEDLARRVVQVREQFSDSLIREPSSLPVMLCSAKAGLGFNNVYRDIARGGILEIQRELAALVPSQRRKI